MSQNNQSASCCPHNMHCIRCALYTRKQKTSGFDLHFLVVIIYTNNFKGDSNGWGVSTDDVDGPTYSKSIVHDLCLTCSALSMLC